MPWPAYISNVFDTIPEGINSSADESMFYGPYNALLTYYLFPPTDHYLTFPLLKRLPESSSIDFSPVFIIQRVIQKAMHPIFFLEIKPPGHYMHRLSRAAADDQMRKRFTNLAPLVDLPVMHGVSALGPRLCFYSYTRDNDILVPPRIPPDPERVDDVAPAERWNYDVLSDEGVARLTQVANEVKAMVAEQA